MSETSEKTRDNGCFGCGSENANGLRMQFTRTGPGAVEASYVVPTHYEGAPTVVHGGIQATLLDEALGHAAHADDDQADEYRNIATVDFRLRYRRPCPTGAPLRIRGRLVRVEGRDLYVEGEIVDAAGEVLTQADARWRVLRSA